MTIINNDIINNNSAIAKITPTQQEIEVIKNILNRNEINNNEKFYENNLKKFLKQTQKFVDLLLTNNEKHNLIGKNTIPTLWTRHVIDSLQLINYISNDINMKEDKINNIIDLGSGGGFPSIILAIALQEQQQQYVGLTMIEKSAVKVKFLQQVIRELHIKAQVVGSVVDEVNINNFIPNNSIIISRAFKNICEILQLLKEPLNKEKIRKIILLKGDKWREEIKQCRKETIEHFTIKTYKSVTDQGVVLTMEPEKFHINDLAL